MSRDKLIDLAKQFRDTWDATHETTHLEELFNEAYNAGANAMADKIESLKEKIESFTASEFKDGISWLWVERDRLMAENKRLLVQEDELEQTVSELNSFDVPKEIVKLRTKSKAWKMAAEALNVIVRLRDSGYQKRMAGECQGGGERRSRT